MSKSNFWRRRLNSSIYILFLLMSCKKTEKRVFVEYHYNKNSNFISAKYSNNTTENFIIITPKVIPLNPLSNGKIIEGQDGLSYRIYASIINSESSHLYISSANSKFYEYLLLKKNCEKILIYRLDNKFKNIKFNNYKMYLVSMNDFNSPLFAKEMQIFRKIKYKNFIPYNKEIKYTGDSIITLR